MIMMADNASALVGLIRSESDRLRDYVNSLSSEDLDRPSPCERWNVGEVIAHLVWFKETYGGMMERGLRGDLSPAGGFPPFPPGTPNRQVIIDEFYGQAAIDLRRTLGENVISALGEYYDWLNDLLKGIGPEDWDMPCNHPAGIRTVESFILTILSELALHEWDIRSSLKSSGWTFPSVSDSSVPTILEKIPSNRGRPWSISFPDMAKSPGPIRYRFELTGAAATKTDLIFEGDKGRMEHAEGAAVAADVMVNCETSTFILLMYGRLTLGSAIAANLLTAKGSTDLIAAFDRWLEGS